MFNRQLSHLVDDAAGEEGRGLLTVRVEVERHQSVRPHREVVVHGQNLQRRWSPHVVHTLYFHVQIFRSVTHLWLPKVDTF